MGEFGRPAGRRFRSHWCSRTRISLLETKEASSRCSRCPPPRTGPGASLDGPAQPSLQQPLVVSHALPGQSVSLVHLPRRQHWPLFPMRSFGQQVRAVGLVCRHVSVAAQQVVSHGAFPAEQHKLVFRLRQLSPVKQHPTVGRMSTGSVWTSFLRPPQSTGQQPPSLVLQSPRQTLKSS